MQPAWLSVLSFLVVSALVGLGMIGAGRVLRVRARRDSRLKHQVYECGEEPNGMAWMQFHSRYYVVALFFVLFDVEAVFLMPWAIQMKELAVFGLVEIGIFLFLLLFGYGYIWSKGALTWE